MAKSSIGHGGGVGSSNNSGGVHESEPLLKSSGVKDDGSFAFAESGGYRLSPEGLAAVTAQQQTGALEAHGGLAQLARKIGCANLQRGLGVETGAIEAQRSKYGSNRLPLPAKPSLLELIFEELKDPTILMLVGSAIVSLVLGLGVERDWEHGWIEGTSIIVTVCLVVSVSAMTDYVKAKEFREQQIRLESDKHVNVVRSGSSVTIHPSDLVVGDIVRLAVGDIAPADGVLMDGNHLKFDESALTGETNLIVKEVYGNGTNTDQAAGAVADPFIVSGTNVMQGTGKMLVLAVGTNSIQGKILARIQEEEGNPEKELDDDPKSCCNIRAFFTFGGSPDNADLMEKLDVLAVDIGKIGLIVATAVFLVMLFSWSHGEFYKDDACRGLNEETCFSSPSCKWIIANKFPCQRRWLAEDISTILEFFITAVTILVVAVPEGLPLAVTLALAVSIGRMSKDNNQVKHMDSCETMGSATTICSDKTGTLTENKMTVMRAQIAGDYYEYVVGTGTNDNLGDVIQQQSQKNEALMMLLCECILLNCSPTSKVTLADSSGEVKYEGNATECALIKLTMQLNQQADSFRDRFKEDGSLLDWGIFNIPFSSERKRMSWIVRGTPASTTSRRSKRSPAYRMYSKGAPQQTFDACETFVENVSATGVISTTTLTPAAKRIFEEQVSEYQLLGLRTLALAFKEIEQVPKGGWDKANDLEKGLTLLGVVGIEDPLRASVPGAILECHKAGIDVRMCTGDALTTAIAIAKGCQILRPSDLKENGQPKQNFAMTGAEFDERVHRKDPSKQKVVRRAFDPKINDAVDTLAEPFLLDSQGNKVLDQPKFDELWPTLRVLARCQPEDKLTLVRGMRASKVFMDEKRCAQLFKDHGIRIFPDFQVVAVTGDGTNDAPALKSANVGFAMGIAGTETAKQACDIILLDDNFSSIVKAVMWGRNVYDSISKFIQFQLTVNVVAITLAVIGAFTYSNSPLSAVQMLWVNMIMDSLASLALATERPTPELLDRPPYGKRRPIISKVMVTNIIGHSTYQIGILCWVLFAPQTLPLGQAIEFDPTQGSLHLSFFFNVFVMLQLFNEFNSRRLQTAMKLRSTWSEWNVFDGICGNRMFIGVMIVTFVFQIIIVNFGGVAVNLIPGGLTSDQWAFSVAVGAFGLIWQVLINVLIVIFSPKEYEEKTTDIHIQKPRSPHEMEAEAAVWKEASVSHWDKVRLGVRRGALYSKLFRASPRKGFEIGVLIHTKMAEERRQASIRRLSQDIALKRVSIIEEDGRKFSEEPFFYS